MDIIEQKQTPGGKQIPTKVDCPAIAKILNAIEQRGLFNHFTRYEYLDYAVEDALKVVEAIGKSRNPKFVIDGENRFAYENFIKWCHGDSSMMAIDPMTNAVVPGNLKKGIYIGGGTGTGKSWCMEIMQAYSLAWQFKIMFQNESRPRPLFWQIHRADAICDEFATYGSISEIKTVPILGIQDLGQEPLETLYMGNRLDAVRNLLEYRGDKPDLLTMITSNFRMVGERLLKRYGDRVQSRLTEMCNFLIIKGVDRRQM